MMMKMVQIQVSVTVIKGIKPLNRPGLRALVLEPVNWVVFGVLIGFYLWGGVE